MKEKKTFGDLEIGDSIYRINKLEVIEEEITDAHPYYANQRLICINRRWILEKSAENSYNNYVFSNYEKAEEYIIEKAKERVKWLEDNIDKEIIEFEKLVKFLHGEKEVW